MKIMSKPKIIRKNRNILINNMKLGDGFKSILELINFHQSNINSDNISTQINKWIDNIFGENQITDKKNVYNSYPRECYEKYVKEETIRQIISDLCNVQRSDYLQPWNIIFYRKTISICNFKGFGI